MLDKSNRTRHPLINDTPPKAAEKRTKDSVGCRSWAERKEVPPDSRQNSVDKSKSILEPLSLSLNIL